MSDFEVKHAFPDMGTRVLLLNARPVEQEAKEPRAIFLAFEDITGRRKLEEETRVQFAEASHELHRTKEEL